MRECDFVCLQILELPRCGTGFPVDWTTSRNSWSQYIWKCQRLYVVASDVSHDGCCTLFHCLSAFSTSTLKLEKCQCWFWVPNSLSGRNLCCNPLAVVVQPWTGCRTHLLDTSSNHCKELFTGTSVKDVEWIRASSVEKDSPITPILWHFQLFWFNIGPNLRR